MQTPFPFRLLLVGSLLLAGCAARAVAADVETRKTSHAGLERRYYLHHPKGHEGKDKLPLVICLHGGGGAGKRMGEFMGGFDAVADREGFLACYPDAIEETWNDGRAIESKRSHRENLDDVGFIASLIDTLVATEHVDPARVYVTGASNGAMMTYRLALEIPERLAAVAPVMGAMPANIASAVRPGKPIPLPLLAISGTEDPLVPFEGGFVTFGPKKLGKVLSVSESVALFVARNGCEGAPARSDLEDRDPEDETRVRRELWSGSAPVELLVVEGGGHTWPGGAQYLPKFIIGRVSKDLDAGPYIWSFFKDKRRAP